jgi:hypothetical protein
LKAGWLTCLLLPTADGDFELVSPKRPSLSTREDLAEALLESVEMAWEQGYKPSLNLNQLE